MHQYIYFGMTMLLFAIYFGMIMLIFAIRYFVMNDLACLGDYSGVPPGKWDLQVQSGKG